MQHEVVLMLRKAKLHGCSVRGRKVSPQQGVSFCCGKITWACGDLKEVVVLCGVLNWKQKFCLHLCVPFLLLVLLLLLFTLRAWTSWPSYPIPKYFFFFFFFLFFPPLCLVPCLIRLFYPDLSKATSSLERTSKYSSGGNDFVMAALENSRVQLQGKSQGAYRQKCSAGQRTSDLGQWTFWNCEEMEHAWLSQSPKFSWQKKKTFDKKKIPTFCFANAWLSLTRTFSRQNGPKYKWTPLVGKFASPLVELCSTRSCILHRSPDYRWRPHSWLWSPQVHLLQDQISSLESCTLACSSPLLQLVLSDCLLQNSTWMYILHLVVFLIPNVIFPTVNSLEISQL